MRLKHIENSLKELGFEKRLLEDWRSDLNSVPDGDLDFETSECLEIANAGLEAIGDIANAIRSETTLVRATHRMRDWREKHS